MTSLHSIRFAILGCCLAVFSGEVAFGTNISSNLAEVVTATFVGGEGTEWLTSAAFPGDDTILLSGISLDPELALHGVKAAVLGKDAPALPVVKKFGKFGSGSTGKTKLPKVSEGSLGDGDDLLGGGADGGISIDLGPSKAEIEKRKRAAEEAARLAHIPGNFRFTEKISVEKQDIFAKLSWINEQATGFIGRFDSSLKGVRALCRFPRGSCGITAMAVGKGGGIYVAGFANDRILGASTDCREEKTNRFEDGVLFNIGRYVFLARVSPDLARIDWIRQLKYKAYAPTLRALNDGNIALLGPGYAVFTPDGRMVQAAHTRFTRVSSGSAVCPVTGKFSMVGDWLGRTGREPMRVPRLIIYYPDGRTNKQLLTYGSSFFCPNYMHEVADSAVRRSAYDNDGNFIYSTWSHGGNNCPGRLPYDPERHLPNAMSYGGMSTYCYVVKLDPDHNVKTAILWTSAGSVRVLTAACDGSIAWLGYAHPCWTPNAVSRDDSGMRLVLTEPNLTGFRFFSTAPACGSRVVLGGCNDRENTWAMASGKCNGKPMFLYLTGAVAEEKELDATRRPPLRNPAQQYGGGLMDGYAVLLDLTPKTELGMEYVPPAPRPRPAPKPGDKPKPKPTYEGLVWPTEGQQFLVGEETCATVMAFVRDEHDRMWPSIFGGRAVKGGRFTYSEKAATANFSLDANDLQQSFGDQHQRVLGELVQTKETIDEKTGKSSYEGTGIEVAPKLHVTGMSAWERIDDKVWGVTYKCPYARCTASGALEFTPGNKIPIEKITCEAVFLSPNPSRGTRTSAPNGAYLDFRFSIPGKELGLSGALAEQNIRWRVRCESISHVKAEKVEDPKMAPPPKLDRKTGDEDLGLGV